MGVIFVDQNFGKKTPVCSGRLGTSGAPSPTAEVGFFMRGDFLKYFVPQNCVNLVFLPTALCSYPRADNIRPYTKPRPSCRGGNLPPAYKKIAFCVAKGYQTSSLFPLTSYLKKHPKGCFFYASSGVSGTVGITGAVDTSTVGDGGISRNTKVISPSGK